MPRGKSDKVVFKPYDQSQQWLVPPSADELIPQNHLVRVVNQTIDEMNLEPILRRYDRGGGASRFHPLAMFKILVYGYMTRVYSSRMLAKAVRENVMFMWIAGNQKPDFRTINKFRSTKLKDVMEEVFMSTVKLLSAKGYVKLENYFVDGTKIESAANKYTFVWKRAIETNDRKLDMKLKAFLKEIDRVSEEENVEYGERDLEEMGEQATFTADDVAILAQTLNERIKALDEKPTAVAVKKKLKKDLKRVEKDFLPRKQKYERQRAILGERNSYAKTDPDATFMRMKEDAMQNGQLKPGYNVQIGTENGFVIGYDVYPNPTDTKTLKPHLENMERRLGLLPRHVIADAGYGSQENYAFLEEKGIDAVIKYNTFHKEATRPWRTDPYRSENWPYDSEDDRYRCPQGRFLALTNLTQKETGAGYSQTLHTYTCTSCEGCAVKEKCTKAVGNKSLQRNPALIRLKEKAQGRLLSDDGKKLRKRRAVEVETVFGQVKGNHGFRRFQLRGMRKVAVEWGLLMIGYNIKNTRLAG
ncbi:MAG: IS1182 family transposase [Calothrix sp. SM1_5_4]|nr:IS1182 family transposase [Calothrix sp. SM1_5_4]